MSFLRNRLLRRLSFLGRVADIALVAGLALRVAQRKGMVSDEQMAQLGLSEVADGEPLGITEIALAGAALARLVRRRTK